MACRVHLPLVKVKPIVFLDGEVNGFSFSAFIFIFIFTFLSLLYLFFCLVYMASLIRIYDRDGMEPRRMVERMLFVRKRENVCLNGLWRLSLCMDVGNVIFLHFCWNFVLSSALTQVFFTLPFLSKKSLDFSEIKDIITVKCINMPCLCASFNQFYRWCHIL